MPKDIRVCVDAEFKALLKEIAKKRRTSVKNLTRRMACEKEKIRLFWE